ncbi:VMAP-C domain-containing protein [Streptomyces mirabilis]|uniref:VMAP-C domain-containing protein n=1 Tax=Streptomyces mirabilis TaxID=68239 RepID=UPI0036AE235B
MSQPTREVVRVRNDERTLLAGLPGALAAPLAEAFCQCDEPGWLAVLQVVLPHPLLGLDVDAWRFGPERPAPGHGSGVLRRPVQDAA